MAHLNLLITALLSFAVSGVVSTVTFVAGVRSGKNNADRPVARALYQELYQHFLDLAEGIDSGDPKQNYNAQWVNAGHVPLLRHMSRSGRLGLLPPRLAGRFLRLEGDLDEATDAVVRDIRDKAAPRIQAAIQGSNLLVPSEYSYSVRYAPYFALAPHRIEELYSDPISIAPPSSQIPQYFLLSKQADKDCVSRLAIEIAAIRDQQLADTFPRLQRLRKEIASVVGTLEARIRDPHPLSSTFEEIWNDVFRPS